MKKIFYIAVAGLLVAAMATCVKEAEGPAPDNIEYLGYDSLPGEIRLRWALPDVPLNSNIHQIKVSYEDPLLKKTVYRTASAYSSSITIPKTRAKYGRYTFSIQTESRSGKTGEALRVDAYSGRALPWYEYDLSKATIDTIKLIVAEGSDRNLWAKFPHDNKDTEGEGNLNNLLDGNQETFFATMWGSNYMLNSNHWLHIDLGLDNKLGENHLIALYYTLRHNHDGHHPIAYSLLGSVLGDEVTANDDLEENTGRWFTIASLTKDDNGLPSTRGMSFRSLFYSIRMSDVRYLRFKVTKTTNSDETQLFWDLAEFGLLKIEVKRELRNPEDPDANI
jgi:hypothetical protein